MSHEEALVGVKILDFSWALMGSLTTKQLADHGATVVKVESALRPCLSRIDKQVEASQRRNLNDKPQFSNFNSSKLSLQINMKHPRMREIIDPLLDWADIVVENFSPGTMEKLGLDYASIAVTHPDIIMLSGSVYGQTGPFAKNWGVDGTGAALSGRMLKTGWQDRDPVSPSVPYGDVVLPYFMGATILAALDYRDRTGQGQYIDASMYEVCVQQMAEAVVESQLLESIDDRRGNHSTDAFFQGVFPCENTDRELAWIAISVFDEQQWQSLCKLLPNEQWPDFATLNTLDASTMQGLEGRLAQWSIDQERYTLMQTLQDAGVAAGVVQDIEDVLHHDPQLAHRHFLTELDHPELGVFGHQSPPFKLSRTPSQVKLAPAMGQHNEQICKDILKMSASQYQEFVQAELFA
jgi:benzylsuccinate CoA-transferase BbsF subunit